ncbi:putative GNAT superfamily acetyltransferase [Rhodococcus sp. 27YEA15]|uniref:GNAT family N-acetyltransferase n=1 Tax=Rhodococcus sp. 27YEA15 TaxID=3156259 RepID=UPI003C7AFB81
MQADNAVEFRELVDTQEIAELSAVFDEIWATTPGPAHFGTAMLVALHHGGHYVVGAFSGDQMIGGCVGFFVEPLGEVLHSHIAGVLPRFAGKGVGRALKLHQRDWCLERSVPTIRWTFDPLVARNAYFNIERLGADPAEYNPDFYGSMVDGINAGDASDRMLVSWNLAASDAPSSAARVEDILKVLEPSPDGKPHKIPIPSDCTDIAVGIPRDIEQLRSLDREAAFAWRLALREYLEPLVASDQWRSTGFDPSGFYMFTKICETTGEEQVHAH